MRRAIAAGVRVAMGTDSGVTPHGCNLDELPLMVECGMTQAQALHSATLSAAELMGLAHELGSLEPGKRADLVIADGDPRRRHPCRADTPCLPGRPARSRLRRPSTGRSLTSEVADAFRGLLAAWSLRVASSPWGRPSRLLGGGYRVRRHRHV